MSDLTKQLEKILNDTVIKDSLAAPMLQKFFARITELEALTTDLEEKILEEKKVSEKLLERTTNAEKEFESMNNSYGEIRQLLDKVQERELSCIKTELRNEMLESMVTFVKQENNMILRNAELKQTINRVMPIAVHMPEMNTAGYSSGGSVIQSEESTETTITKKE